MPRWGDQSGSGSGRGYGSFGGGAGPAGSWRDAMARAFRGNPLTWAFPLYSAWGIRVRIHVFFILMIIFEFLGTLAPGAPGLKFVAPIWLGLFLLVLLHEYGHCFTCRRVGGEADDILMWPLGGLASCRPPHDWRADLWTTIGGPAVNAALVVPLGALVLALTGRWETVIFYPFELNPVWGALGGSYLAIIAWSLYFTNWMLLLFNVLLPMYPMDGGRILHAILWARMGHAPATRLVVRIGLGVAAGLAVFAIVFNTTRLIGLAIFGGITCWMEMQRQAMMGDDFGSGESWRGGPAAESPEARRAIAQQNRESERQRKQRERDNQRVAAEQSEVDRLLDKIRDHGMQSLSPKERKFLEAATKRRRGA
ncbi:MAG: hypothetical protein KDA05_03425 [Phycisphaerales bacterium]|nr:hypothetical protein [Phycisphaerales bacterium]